VYGKEKPERDSGADFCDWGGAKNGKKRREGAVHLWMASHQFSQKTELEKGKSEKGTQTDEEGVRNPCKKVLWQQKNPPRKTKAESRFHTGRNRTEGRKVVQRLADEGGKQRNGFAIGFNKNKRDGK